MKTTLATLMEFIGGPFDGFHCDLDPSVSGLPEAVSLPLDRRSARLFGCSIRNEGHEAIYRLHSTEAGIQYRFVKCHVPHTPPRITKS